MVAVDRARFRRRGRAFAALAGAALALSLAPAVIGGSASSTIWVDDDGYAGPNQCNGAAIAATTVQAGVDASDIADTVLVCPGTYVGTVSIGGAQHAGLTLKSVRQGEATLMAPLAPFAVVSVIDADHVRILGFRVIAPTTQPCRRVEFMIYSQHASGTVIRDNLIRAVGITTGLCGYETGIEFASGANGLIRDNVVWDFTFWGIRVDAGSGRVISNSIRYEHLSRDTSYFVLDSRGISVLDASVEVRRNQLVGPASAGSTTPLLYTGIYGQSTVPGELIVRRNIVKRTYVGLELNMVSGALLSDNVSRHNFGADCVDQVTGGTGTAGTDNFWIDNVGDPATSQPSGICSLP